MTRTQWIVVAIVAVASAFAPEVLAAAAATARYVVDSYALMYIDAEGLRLACL